MKSEIRNPKSEGSPNSEARIRGIRREASCLGFRAFGFLSDFGLRISDFYFLMELKDILESVLFSAQEPLSVKDFREVLKNAAEHSPDAGDFKKTSFEDVVAALDVLTKEHEAAGRSYRLVCVAERWQFVTQPEFAPWVKALVGERARPSRLSQPALETLAIIAYRQPITHASNVSAPERSASTAACSASSTASAPSAVINWVPLTSDRPSFAWSRTGDSPAAASASAPDLRTPS